MNNMSLKQRMPYEEYKKALLFSKGQCEFIAKMANLKIPFDDNKSPGELLIKYLDRDGITLQQYNYYVTSAANARAILTYYRPTSKIAILIANEKYTNLSKLVTPSIDCEALSVNLVDLGFITLTVKNLITKDLKVVLQKVFQLIPDDSYCFIFYAGHGCELCNTKCMLSPDCPVDNVEIDHCVTENFVLHEVAKCKPELCVFIMDMCRNFLDSNMNPKIYSQISTIEEYSIHSNLLIGYSTQSSQAAYEVLQIECSTILDNNVTYELKTGDSARIVPCASQYVNALCSRMKEDLDVNTLLDKVHADVENAMKKQRPIKVQCGVARRSLYDCPTGDLKHLAMLLKEVCEEYSEFCRVDSK